DRGVLGCDFGLWRGGHLDGRLLLGRRVGSRRRAGVRLWRPAIVADRLFVRLIALLGTAGEEVDPAAAEHQSDSGDERPPPDADPAGTLVLGVPLVGFLAEPVEARRLSGRAWVVIVIVERERRGGAPRGRRRCWARGGR